MSNLKLLITQRKVIRKKVTDAFNKLGSYANFTASRKISEKCLLLSYQKGLLDLDSKIQNSKFEDSAVTELELEEECLGCIDYLEKIERCLPLLEVSPSRSVTDTALSLLKQPTAPLPKFSSKENEDLLQFFVEFEATTGVYKYPDRDLLLLLKQQVEGRAKVLLNSLEADKQSYQDAKSLLIKASASEEVRKSSTVKKLTELKLNPGDDPFNYVSRLRNLCESTKVLQMSSDDFLTYFAWLGLNDEFRKELVQITNKTSPSITEILDNFFVACERYENSRKVSNVTPSKHSLSCNGSAENADSFASLAVKVHSPKNKVLPSCSLCSKVHGKDFNHVLYKCTKFPTPQSKVDKLKYFKGCLKCASFSHPTAKCYFRFKQKCFKCFGWHFSFLCNKDNSSDCKKSEEAIASTETNNGVTVFSNFVSDSVLPTFTFGIVGQERLYRGIKDSGSQSTFVSQKLADTYDFETIRNNVNLTIHGFNGVKTYRSKVVQVPITLGNGRYKIPAMVIPEIKIKLNLPMLGTAVKGFLDKGFSFADGGLHSNIREVKDIEFLLGSDAAYCIPSKDVLFGKGTLSVYVDSPMGVMLVGNVQRLIDNIDFLPCHSMSVSASIPSPPSVESLVSVHTHSLFVADSIIPTLDDEVHDLHYDTLKVSSNFSVLNDKGKLMECKLQKATNEILELECPKFINYDQTIYEEETVELNKQLVDYTFNNISREVDGRIRVPLLWNGEVSHLLSKNEHLAEVILKSNFRKLKNNVGYLHLMDQTIKDQIAAGIIKPIHDLEQYKALHPDYAFLPHMGIFKPERETTKCRVVFLSNLRENEKNKKLSLSLNQCVHPGPTLNQKLSSAFLHLRFGQKLLTYDLKKAFNMLSLSESDQSKLLFLWYKNVKAGDFSVVAYRNVRLSFGLRCSPFLLMLSLYYILVFKEEKDKDLSELKHLMYTLLYMDNGAITMETGESLEWAYNELPRIFAPYKFEVQQIITNDNSLQIKIDEDMKTQTPETTKLFGLAWDRVRDEIFTKPICLDGKATTKRAVLGTIASQFDIYGFNMPILNRSRLFMHRLQCNKNLGWDALLPLELQREWVNICKQANASPPIKIGRYVGPRNGTYKLMAYTDASHDLYGSVIFLQHVESGKVSFVQAKNRMINTQLKNKSIPSLELNAIVLGVETLVELQRDISGPSCLKPVNIVEMVLYADSLCALHCLNSSSQKLDKMQRCSTFVMNRIGNIQKLCQRFPIRFCFISGKENPADCVTRCLSHKQLYKTNFLVGPGKKLDDLPGVEHDMTFIIPNLMTVTDSGYLSKLNAPLGAELSQTTFSSLTGFPEYVIDPCNYSSFRKLILIYRRILVGIRNWKSKAGICSQTSSDTNTNLFAEASKRVVITEQRKWFPEIFAYFQNKNSFNLKAIPNLITQLNIFMDENGILRVKSKFKKWFSNNGFPILLPRDSALTKLIILDVHFNLFHAGCYSVLAEIRRQFHIPRHFSTIKKALKQCVHCRRFCNRTFKLSQNSYREFRSNLPSKPFANVFIDHMGPFHVRKNNETQKVWRPIAFKESLREEDLDFIPEPITPEQLVKGYELTSMNLLPELQGIPDEDPDWQPCRGIKIGDIVLLKEVHTKPNNYPMGLVKELQYNSIGEVTGASIQKGSTREVVKRHITTLVPFLERLDDSELSSTNDSVKLLSEPPHVKRKAAIVSEQKTREILTE
ncbi:uncharacterized protein [Palaemon carinicauda]|uniref:uncharacterized protein n=1 Tax=Palaemon carinicauda TaxID=392227 RepID=UPI0035B5B100